MQIQLAQKVNIFINTSTDFEFIFLAEIINISTITNQIM